MAHLWEDFSLMMAIGCKVGLMSCAWIRVGTLCHLTVRKAAFQCNSSEIRFRRLQTAHKKIYYYKISSNLSSLIEST